MSKKKEWRTRKRGTKAQIGTRFPLAERGDKGKLPSDLKQVTYPQDVEPDNLREEIEQLANDLDHAVQTDDLERIIQLYLELEALEKQIELIDSPQGVRREKLKRALDETKRRASEYSDKVSEQADEKLFEGTEYEGE